MRIIFKKTIYTNKFGIEFNKSASWGNRFYKYLIWIWLRPGRVLAFFLFEDKLKTILSDIEDLKNPYPAEVFTMTDEEYIKAIPNSKLRTRISGYLMRQGWDNAKNEIIKIINK